MQKQMNSVRCAESNGLVGVGVPQRRNKSRRQIAGVCAAATAAAAATAIFTLGTSSADAATKTWNTAGSGNWSLGTNWSVAGQPANGDTVNLVDNDATNRTVTFDDAVTTTSLTAMTVESTGTGTMTLLFPTGSTKTLTITGTETIGSTTLTGQGFVQQEAATHIISNLVVGNNAGSTGSYLLNGTGVLTVSGTLTLANLSSASGTYNQSGGSFTAANERIGVDGLGIVNHSAGTHVVNGAGGADAMTLGVGGASVGDYFLSGSGTVSVTATGGLVIGKGAIGLFDQTGGTLTVGTVPNPRNVLLGSDPGSQGSYSLSGTGAMTVNGSMFVGGTSGASGGTGNFFMDAGTATITGTMKIWPSSGTSAIVSGGTLNVGVLDTSSNPTLFAWNAGTLNITGVGGLTIGAAGPLGSSVQLGAGKSLGVGAVTTVASGAELIIGGGSLTTSSFAGAGSVAFNGGSLTLTSSALLVDTTGPLGASIEVPAGSAVSVSGLLTNNGTIHMTAGSIGGASALNNNGVITGSGVFIGAGGINNGGLISINDGNMTVTKIGILQNLPGGVIQLDAGRQLQVNAGNLQNSGTLDLDGGGTINSTSAAQLINTADGLIVGAGTIALPMQNSGFIVVPTGTLNVSTGFTNNGQIELETAAARLTVGGTGVINAAGGVIEGHGRVSGTLANTGRVEAQGGTLTIAGASTNNVGGLLCSGTGSILLITGAPGANAGTISLTGGTLDTNSQAITNAVGGVISGRGTFRTGGLNNSGQFLLAGGTSDVYGAVTGAAASKVILSGSSSSYFYNNVTMNAGSEFRINAGSNAVFYGPVTGTSFFTGGGTKSFEGGSSNLGALITPGTSVVQTGASITTTVIREAALTVDGGQATVLSNGTQAATSNIGTLSVTAGGKLDLKNNNLVIQNASLGTWNGSAYTGVTGLISTGLNGGAWNGPGIVTSEAAAVVSHLTTLAPTTADALGVAGGTWGGQPVESGDVLVMYTYAGDANLDGKLNIDDYGAIDFNVPLQTKGYAKGDFNLDGKINIDDYGLIDFNVGIQGAPFVPGAGSGGEGLAVTAVPEPTGVGVLVLSAAALAGRRRRRRYPQQ